MCVVLSLTICQRQLSPTHAPAPPATAPAAVGVSELDLSLSQPPEAGSLYTAPFRQPSIRTTRHVAYCYIHPMKLSQRRNSERQYGYSSKRDIKNASTCLQELREECLVERNSPRVLRADCVAGGAPAECVPPRHESRASRRADRLHVCAQQQT